VNTRCAQCEYPIAPATPPTTETGQLRRSPQVTPKLDPGQREFSSDTTVLLQVLPSGRCLNLALKQPAILGRQASSGPETVVDLSDLNALQHGVSRHHCRLERRSRHLVVIDLDSANGSYLNSEPLLPHRPYVVASGDKLILGTLHIAVSFHTLNA